MDQSLHSGWETHQWLLFLTVIWREMHSNKMHSVEDLKHILVINLYFSKLIIRTIYNLFDFKIKVKYSQTIREVMLYLTTTDIVGKV